MRDIQKKAILESMLEKLDLPDHAYQKVKERYEDLGKWFERGESSVKDFNLHIFPQGSFMLGTTIRPLNEDGEYDLDFGCKVTVGVNKLTHTQKELKELIGEELEAYRKARGIQKELIAKHRCWRLEYKDDLRFHLDIVPSIPEESDKKDRILEAMRNFGTKDEVAEFASKTVMAITDDRHPHYEDICEDWKISNPEGYAKWFEQRTFPSELVFEARNQVDELPLFQRKAPLQRVIQLLKRHRDLMFEGEEDSKPISIIISTLAARAYEGENDIQAALINVLDNMAKHINSSRPRVPNPVNPNEDFTDRWDMPECRHLNLEHNFRYWLISAQNDFNSILSSEDPSFIKEQAELKFSVRLNEDELAKRMGISQNSAQYKAPDVHVITAPARPWGMEE